MRWHTTGACIPRPNASAPPVVARPPVRSRICRHDAAVAGCISPGTGDWGLGTGDWGLGIRDSGFGIRDSGFGIRDSGFGIRDSGFGIRDSGFDLTPETTGEFACAEMTPGFH